VPIGDLFLSQSMLRVDCTNTRRTRNLNNLAPELMPHHSSSSTVGLRSLCWAGRASTTNQPRAAYSMDCPVQPGWGSPSMHRVASRAELVGWMPMHAATVTLSAWLSLQHLPGRASERQWDVDLDSAMFCMSPWKMLELKSQSK